ncbi:MAG: CoA pyrophosphatase [Bacteroidetes bacterium]|nr:MAG: CoA pyrophosphatase [Bacteroidota bacterium]
MNNYKIQKEVDFLSFLKERLTKPLPGHTAHLKMQPMHGNREFRSLTPNNDTTPSAVLVLLTKNKEINDFEVLLTLRSTNIRHSGQISCPGGFKEEGEDAIITALREAKEEIGIEADNILILGSLSDLYVQPSNTLITPVLAYISEINDLNVNKEEVDEVFFIKLSTLLDKNVYRKELWNLKGNEVEVPFWNVHPTTPLWGATAMILKELLFLYDEFLELIKSEL